MKGKGNSQYGSIWITNGYESRKIKSNEVLPEGYRKGRIINFRAGVADVVLAPS